MTTYRWFQRSVRHWLLRAVACAGMLLVLVTPAAAADTERWLLVDTQKLTLTVMDGELPQLTLHNLAIGRYGASAAKRRGDNTTPLGRFRITGIERDSGFHRFIQLDYPDVVRTERAYRAGVIGAAEYRAILAAHRRGVTPPQGTALGGHIGIHGLGEGDPVLHRTMNWTRGCVALTDQQIDTLLPWVHVGMVVEIR